MCAFMVKVRRSLGIRRLGAAGTRASGRVSIHMIEIKDALEYS
jgi:hypothetical protein